jgi:hypothetical protein
MRLERDPNNPYVGNGIIPDAATIELLQQAVARLEQQEISAREVALQAVLAGFLLIGTPVSKPVHYPVAREEHRYYDIRDGSRQKFHERRHIPGPLPERSLRAGKNPDIAIICGLFGDYNNREERIRTCMPFTGQEDNNFGWGNDVYAERSKSWRKAYFAEEGSPVSLFAHSELINAARENRLRGNIDCIYNDSRFAMTVADVAQFIGPVVAETVLSIPLQGWDLPMGDIPSRYDDLSNLAK